MEPRTELWNCSDSLQVWGHTDTVKFSKNKGEVWHRLAASGRQKREKQLASEVAISLIKNVFACQKGRPRDCRRRFGPKTEPSDGNGAPGAWQNLRERPAGSSVLYPHTVTVVVVSCL